jgi:hypothetical protein
MKNSRGVRVVESGLNDRPGVSASAVKELADIKKLLQASAARAAAPAAPHVRNLVLDVGSNPFRGEATAKLTLVEFTDYQ